MNAPRMTLVPILLTLLGTACASAPSKPVSSGSAAATGTPLGLVDGKSPITVGMPPPMKLDPTKLVIAYDRVALIWGDPSCLARPWVVTVVDLGSRMVTFRTLAASTELDLYWPSPTGEVCVKGPCPTMAVEMPIPPSLTGPSITSGTGTMGAGMGKGRYSMTTSPCPEPPMLADADLVDLAARLVAGRNDAASAVAARGASSR
jgi:hypothetical protein